MDNSNFIKLKDIKAFILERKILLNILNEEYIKYSNLARILHVIFVLIPPVVSLVDLLLGECNDGLVTVVFGVSIVIIMKLREIFNYKRLQEQTKEQSVKYRQLYNRIKEEEDKVQEKRQNDETFIYWIVREYNNIQLNDPDIPMRINEKFIILCKEHNIEWNSDINILEKLLNDFSSPLVQSPIQSPIQSPRRRIEELDKHELDKHELDKHELDKHDTPIIENKNIDLNKMRPIQANNNEIIISLDKLKVRRLSHMLEKSEREYKFLSNNANFKDDTQWTITRLKNL
jgi:hypothetical protein